MNIARFRVIQVKDKKCQVAVEGIGEGFSEKNFQWATFMHELNPQAPTKDKTNQLIKTEKSIINEELNEERIAITDASAEGLITEGERVYAAERYSDALILFRRAYNKDPFNIVAKNKIEETDKKIKEQANKKNFMLFNEQAGKYLKNGDIKSAFLTLVRALEEIPSERETISKKIGVLRNDNSQIINDILIKNDEQFKNMGDEVAFLMAELFIKYSNSEKSMEYLKSIKDKALLIEFLKTYFEIIDKSGKLDQIDNKGGVYFEIALLYRQKGDYRRAGKLFKYAIKKGVPVELIFDKIGVSKLFLNLYNRDATFISGVLFSEKISTNINGYPEGTFANNSVMVYIPVGNYAKKEILSATKDIYVDSCWIQKYEVSIKQYKEYMLSKNDPNVNLLNDFSPNEDYPISLLLWKEASEYCSWLADQSGLDFRLPKAIEWEKAATGPSNKRRYPWGDFSYVYNKVFYANFTGIEDGFEYAAPVAFFEIGRSPFGIYNLVGNVWEWGIEGPFSDRKYVFGGSWSESPQRIVYSIRNISTTKKYKDVGFRTAMTSR